MCGLAGLFNPNINADEWETHLHKMASVLTHRGPDDQGIWFDPVQGIGLAHRRLSVLDLTEQGRQPMVSASGRYVIAYNGEVYNFGQLRRELESGSTQPGAATGFRGHSDTEVLLEAIERWGLFKALKRFTGMFAFALWDRQDRTLQLVRDRVGIKPLYYGKLRQGFIVASELKAFRAFPGFSGDIDRDALALFMRHGYIPSPHSIYRGVYKLPPGTALTLSAKSAGTEIPVPYWSLSDVVEGGIRDPFQGSEAEALRQFEDLLSNAVKLRMISDVPLGAFLSGGIDSSLITLMMQRHSQNPIKTFCVGFENRDFDESPHARSVAKHIGCEHTEIRVTPEMAMDVIPRLPAIYDEPFADASQIPTFLVSEMTRHHVTVALSGDGGDELFGGYNRYFMTNAFLKSAGRLPLPIRKFLAGILGIIPNPMWNQLASLAGPVLPPRWKQAKLAYLAHKLRRVLPLQDRNTLYHKSVSHWDDPSVLVLGSREPSTMFHKNHAWNRENMFSQWMMYVDSVTSLPDDILTKVDRASMAVGLEVRVPLLDHRIVEFAWKIPPALKLRNGNGKWLLKQLLYKHLPEKLVNRPKMGFGIPIGNWLCGPLRDWAENLLDERKLREGGYLDPHPVRKIWAEHLADTCNWQYQLWNVLMFQAWLKK